MCTYVSFVTDCKSDTTNCKFHQPLQSTLTAIQLTITRGGRTGRGLNENFTPAAGGSVMLYIPALSEYDILNAECDFPLI